MDKKNDFSNRAFSEISGKFTFSDHLIFSILLQHQISKLSKYFCSDKISV